ncbi:thiamine biosynthetic bifunctional enzyme [Sporothrix epigloea]|uniref:Thiamine biosynthetic bifunctional enzyme n=1 Tax=Sporothrix epigloea TaxID=1892477 RepID=A0ABP0E1W0_9PEZI
MASYCCTCATPLPAGISIPPAGLAPPISPTSPTTGFREKAVTDSPQHRQLPCCDRVVCSRCLTIATAPPLSLSSSGKHNKPERTLSGPVKDLLPPGLKPPPPYRPRSANPAGGGTAQNDAAPPPYDALPAASSASELASAGEKRDVPVLHYLDHSRDTIASLSLRYNVPADRLRKANHLTADYLLQARHVIQIPLSGRGREAVTESQSPRPVDDEAELRRKTAIRRFMVACKVVDYDLAVLYLEQTVSRRARRNNRSDASLRHVDDDGDYDLQAAVEAFTADEHWEKSHPMDVITAGRQKAARRDQRKLSSSQGFFPR